MKHICKIKIHPFFYLLSIICILTGLFKKFIIFMFIIIVHELGHIISGIFLKQKIEKVIILPFGGLTIFKMPLNLNIYKELIIATCGPLFQLISFLILNKYLNNNYYYKYNLAILIFNLLPIYPLDGSKILNSICNLFFCFKVAFYTSMSTSLVSIIIICLLAFKTNLWFMLVFLFLIYKTISETVNYKNIYNKFLWERYIHHYNFHKIKYINNISFFYKDKRHLIYNNERYYSEKEFLRKRFDFKRKMC